jgi:hypothetical protein
MRVANSRLTVEFEPCAGDVAQLGERLLCKQEVIGSIPFSSTNKGKRHPGNRVISKFIGKSHGLPLIFDRTEKVRLFFNKTEEVKRTRRSIVVCWVRLYRSVPLEFGGNGYRKQP